MRLLLKLFIVFSVLASAGSGALYALPVFYSGSSGNLAASASFDLAGSTLTVTLANTSISDVTVPSEVLTGLFFNSNYALTPVSVSLNDSLVFYGSTNDPGKGWGYKTGVSAHGMNSALSASGAVAGLGQSNFSSITMNLQGLDYGLLSAGDDAATGNGGLTGKGKGPLFNNSLEFTLRAPQGFTLDNLGADVVFQYGTSLLEPSFWGAPPISTVTLPTPEPGTFLLLGTGFGALALAKRRSLKAWFNRKSSGFKGSVNE